MAKTQYKVEGTELKKLVKFAKDTPIGFGFNPGANESEHYFGLHRKHPAKLIGKEAKDAGPGKKWSFGTMSIVGKEMHLTCERELPAMAKKLKRWLKKQKVNLNVIIMDASGNILEQDVEDGLPDDPDMDDTGQDTGAPQASEPTAPSGPDTSQIMARLKDVSERIKALPEDHASKLAGPFKAVAQQAQSGDVAGAEAGAEKIEQALDKLEAALAGQKSEPKDPQAQKLLQAVETLRSQANPIQDEQSKAKILKALDDAAASVENGLGDDIMGVLKGVAGAIKNALGLSPDEDKADPNQAKWLAQYAKLEAAVNDAKALDGKIDPNHPDLQELNRLWKWANDNAGDEPPNYAKALETVPAIIEVIKKIREAKASGDGSMNVNPEVKPFAEAQLTWNRARGTMMAELKKLQDAIVQVCADDPELEGVAEEVGTLNDYISGLDERLEDALAQIVSSEAGPAREQLKKNALGILTQYQAELDSDFFKVVDGGNGFTNVAVTQTASSALGGIAQVLS